MNLNLILMSLIRQNYGRKKIVPVKIVGKMTLNRNVDNVFAETEQVAFHPGHVVPGIDFSNDPLLQGRLFSYTDTQLIRLGGPNFHEIPINRPVCPFHNNQRDGYGRQTINKGQVSYHNNSLLTNTPATAQMKKKADIFIIKRKWKDVKSVAEVKALRIISPKPHCSGIV